MCRGSLAGRAGKGNGNAPEKPLFLMVAGVLSSGVVLATPCSAVPTPVANEGWKWVAYLASQRPGLNALTWGGALGWVIDDDGRGICDTCDE